jgi:hypothetical protein
MKWLLGLILFFDASIGFAVNYPIGSAPLTIISAGDMSAASITSPTIPFLGIDNINIQCVWTGTPTGTFAINVSLDGTNWTALTISPSLSAAGSASNFDLDLNQLGAAYFQVVYTKSGSTGTLNCMSYGKKV